MASKDTIRNQFVFNQNTKTTLIDGYAAVSDSVGTVGASSISGGVVVRSGVGQYDLLLDKSYPLFLGLNVTVHSPNSRTGYETEVIWHNVLGTVSPLGWAAQTIRFVFLNGTTPAELPANAGFNIILLVKDSVAPAGQ